MKADKALELVQRYSALQWTIRACRARIGRELDKCRGVKGKRLETEGRYNDPTPEAQADQDTHLKGWYTPEEVDDNYSPRLEYQSIGEIEREECPHCYAAHLIVQERKAARKAFGAVKAAMTRTTPKPAILSEPFHSGVEPE
jgi:hypothetical protein